MFAVVEISGFQYRVQPSDILAVPQLEAKVGEQISLTKILAAGEGSNVRVGTPTINGSVSATVLAHDRAEKVIVFHKKRRKGYRKKNGHRQRITQIKIDAITLA